MASVGVAEINYRQQQTTMTMVVPTPEGPTRYMGANKTSLVVLIVSMRSVLQARDIFLGVHPRMLILNNALLSFFI